MAKRMSKRRTNLLAKRAPDDVATRINKAQRELTETTRDLNNARDLLASLRADLFESQQEARMMRTVVEILTDMLSKRQRNEIPGAGRAN